MIQFCEYPDCENSINGLPNGHSLCSDHQVEYKSFKSLVSTWTEERGLPKEELWFAFTHRDGFLLGEFALLIRRRPSTLQTYRRKGLIDAEWSEEHSDWVVPIYEYVRFADIKLHWIVVEHALTEYDEQHKGFREAVKRGVFGSVRQNLSGHSVILRRDRKEIKTLLRDYRRAIFRRTKIRKYLAVSEYLLPRIASLCGVRENEPHRWRSKGWLRCQRRGWWWVVTRKGFLDFLRGVSGGYFAVKKELRIRCHELLIELMCEGKSMPSSIDSLPVTESDKRFIFSHPKGCTLYEIACHYRDLISLESLQRAVREGFITAKPQKEQLTISFDEMGRIIDILRNWISTPNAANHLNGVSRGTLRSYAIAGELGPHVIDLFGNIAIPRSILPHLQKQCGEIAKSRRATANHTMWRARRKVA